MNNKLFQILALSASVWLLGASTGLCGEFENAKQAADRYLHGGELSQAIVHYQEALQLDPSSTAVRFNLAVAYYQSRDIPRAKLMLEGLIKLDTNDYEAYYNLACLALYEKDLETAGAYLEKARSYCLPNGKLTPLIAGTLEFVRDLRRLDPQTRGVILQLLIQRQLN